MELEYTTHYLKLAYLLEASIVFSLAYLELKAKRNFIELVNKMNSPGNVAFTHNIYKEDGICKKTNCPKCTEKSITSRFQIIDIIYIVKMINDLSRVHHSYYSDYYEIYNNGTYDRDNKSSFKALFLAWHFSMCKIWKRYLIFLFHFFVRNNIDRIITIFSLVVTVLLLIILSMVDNNVFYSDLLSWSGLWSAVDIWTFWIWLAMVGFIVITGIFWKSWGMLIREYECLSMLLSQAYQIKLKTYPFDLKSK